VVRVIRPVIAVLVLAACRGGPSDEALDRQLAEARAANTAALAEAAKSAKQEPGFTLTVAGQIGKPSATLAWDELQRIGQTHVETINVQNPDKQSPTDFRGILVRDLLDRFAADPSAGELTFVAVDAFRATVSAADARAMRMLLAIEADGAPIPPSSGGPIFLVHPHSESPEARAKYPDRFWSFYVTHLVVGTEVPRLKVGDQIFEAAQLAALPTNTYDGPVSWKVEWPSGTVHVRGVRLSEIFKAAGVPLPAGAKILVRGKAPLHRDPEKPITIAVDDLARCNPLLALSWGPDEKPITAKYGGPITLAVPPCGEAYGERAWVTFVEELEVLPP
jgi:hypothetical protein